MVFSTDGTEAARIDTSGNVGIGTSSPSSLLHVQGGSSSGVIQLGTTGGAGREWKHIVSSSTGYYFLQDSTAGSNRIAVDTSGTVDIGTTSPASLLHLNSASDPVLRLQRGGGVYSQFQSDSAGSLYLSADAGNTGASSRMQFNVDGSEAARIDSSGNVYIGTTNLNPVSGNVTGTTIKAQGNIQASRDGGVVISGNRKTSDGEIFELRKDGTNVGNIGVYSLDRLYIADQSNGLQFDQTVIRPCDNTGANTDDVITLGGSGSRFKDFYLSGTASVAKTRLTTNNTTYWDLRRDSSTGDFVVSDDGLGDVLTILQSNGNVGIGTSSPSYTLDVDGDVRFYDANGSSANYYFESDHYSQINLTSDKDASAGGPYNTAITANGSNGNLELRTNSLQRVSIDQSGNVGIGTTSPIGLGGATVLQVNDSGTDYAQLRLTNSTSGSTVNQGFEINFSGINVFINNRENGAMAFYNNGSERMRITSSGNVGIGTTSPASALDVVGNITTSGDITVNGNQIFTDNVTARVKFAVWTNTTYGIGMDNVYNYGGLSDYAMTFQMSDTDTRGFWWGDLAHTNSQGAMSLTTTGLLTVANGMRLGYGQSDTTSPTSGQLDVNGTVNATTFSGALSGNATTATGLSATLAVASGGTGATTLTANNVLLGNGTSAVQAVAPGTSGNVLTSDGTTWTSAAPSGGGSLCGFTCDNTAGNAALTALGVEAGVGITTGDYITAIGYEAAGTCGNGGCSAYVGAYSGQIASGVFNTAVGYCTMSCNTCVTGRNVAIGFASQARSLGSCGYCNTSVGACTLLCHTTARCNVAVGVDAMRCTTTAFHNVAVGARAMCRHTTGNYNTAVGTASLSYNNSGTYNTAMGRSVMLDNTTGACNVAVGASSLWCNISGGQNTAVGYSAGGGITGCCNTVVGANAMGSCCFTGCWNVVMGSIAMGGFTLAGAKAACNNIVIGTSAGYICATAPVSGFISMTTQCHHIIMGNAQHTCAQIQIGWTTVSDCRDKTCFKDVPHGLDFVNALKPTEYQFRKRRDAEETDGVKRYGFLAQDVIALEGDDPVVASADDPDKLKYTEAHMVPILVKAIQELSAEVKKLKET